MYISNVVTWWISRLQIWGCHGNAALGIHGWVGTHKRGRLSYWLDEAGQPLPTPAAQREVGTSHTHILIGRPQLHFNWSSGSITVAWHFIDVSSTAAKKMCLVLCRDRCEQGVMSSVNVRNCICFYQTAEELNAATLMNYCGEIIASHWVSVCMKQQFGPRRSALTLAYMHVLMLLSCIESWWHWKFYVTKPCKFAICYKLSVLCNHLPFISLEES